MINSPLDSKIQIQHCTITFRKVEMFSYFVSQQWHHHMLELAQTTVLPAKSNSDVMFCLQSYKGFIIGKSLVY